MPKRIDNVIRVDLPDPGLYKRLERDRVLEMSEDGIIKAGSAGALAGKLLQLANGAVYDREGKVQHIHDAKLEALAEIIDDAAGKPVMVCYWFKHDLSRIEAYFKAKKVKTVRMEGPTVVKDWNDQKIPVLLVHPASAGHGLNLQRGGNTIVWFGLTHDLELYQQANARIFRQGQTEDTVIINHIVAAGTVDEDILPALTAKEATQAQLMEAVKARVEKYAG
jgi:SNF2 family DNA or RNA helicase